MLEILREEKQLGELATELGLSPHQLRNWKKEFLENAAKVFSQSKKKKDLKAKKERWMKIELAHGKGRSTHEFNL